MIPGSSSCLAWHRRPSGHAGRGAVAAVAGHRPAGFALVLLAAGGAGRLAERISHLETWWRTVAIARQKTPTRTTLPETRLSVRNQSFANAARRFGNWAHYCSPVDRRRPRQLATGPADRTSDGSRRFDRRLLAVRGLAAVSCWWSWLSALRRAAISSGRMRRLWPGLHRHAGRLHDRPGPLLLLCCRPPVIRPLWLLRRRAASALRSHAAVHPAGAGARSLRCSRIRRPRRTVGARHDRSGTVRLAAC